MIYLDNHATTPMDPRIVQRVLPYFADHFGNPSSSEHLFGDLASSAVADAQSQVAALVDTLPDDVVFTSGATESVNIALQGFARSFIRQRGVPARLLVSATEHSAVLQTAAALAAQELAEVRTLPVDGGAAVDLDALSEALKRGADLVCVMAANNEVGTINPIEVVGRACAEAGALFFCDASQAVGRIPVSAAAARIAFLVLSGHKMYGPKGVGALVVANRRGLDPISWGGSQQGGIRPGTLNVPGIVGLGEACRLRHLEMGVDEPRIAAMRDSLEQALNTGIPGLAVNGHRNNRLAGNLHVSVVDVPNDAVIARVRERVAIATGAACTSGIEAPSHVLAAMQLTSRLQAGALRIGVGKFNTPAEISEAALVLVEAVEDTRRLMLSPR